MAASATRPDIRSHFLSSIDIPKAEPDSKSTTPPKDNGFEDEDYKEEDDDASDASEYAPTKPRGPAKRKATDSTVDKTPSKTQKTTETPKKRTPAKPRAKKRDPVHIAEPMLDSIKKTLARKTVNEKEIKLPESSVKAIVEYIDILRNGCEEAGLIEKLFNKDGEQVQKLQLTEAEAEAKADNLRYKIVADLRKQMKWTSACRYGGAKMSTEGVCLDGPPVMLKLLKLKPEDFDSKKTSHTIDYDEETFRRVFEDSPESSVRYDTLVLRFAHVRWNMKTGEWKVWGTYGKQTY